MLLTSNCMSLLYPSTKHLGEGPGFIKNGGKCNPLDASKERPMSGYFRSSQLLAKSATGQDFWNKAGMLRHETPYGYCRERLREQVANLNSGD